MRLFSWSLKSAFSIMLLMLTNSPRIASLKSFSSLGHRRIGRLLPSLCTSISTETESLDESLGRIPASVPANGDADDFIKRKVAFVLAYVGSQYHGLQMDPTYKVTTIESVVEKALNTVGCIRDSNMGDLGKIRWDRSSRTDKGVHAARMVITAKLELKKDWIDNESKRVHIVGLVNAALPPDIRMLSCHRVNKSFRARQACSWREYEYILPLSVLVRSNECEHVNSEEVISEFNKILKIYEGTHYFHNFHRLSKKDLNRSRKAEREFGRTMPGSRSMDAVAPPVVGSRRDMNSEPVETPDEKLSGLPSHNMKDFNKVDSDDNLEEDSFVEDFVADEEMACDKESQMHGSELSRAGQVRTCIFDGWEAEPREMAAKTICNMYLCEASAFDVTPYAGLSASNDGSEAFVRIVLRGQSFLLNQIRLMVGAAVAVARGALPRLALELAMESEVRVRFPLAPAEGLVLVGAGFDPNTNNEDITLAPHAQLTGREMLLLSKTDFKTSEEFKRESIYRQIACDWTDDEAKLRQQVNVSLQMHTMSGSRESDLFSEWSDILTDARTKQQLYEQEKDEKEHRRQRHLIEKFLQQLTTIDGKNSVNIGDGLPNGQSSTDHESSITSSKLIKRKKFKPFHHRLFLPNGLATQIMVRFRVQPSDKVINVLKVLATKLVQGEVPISTSVVELVDFVDQRGGIDWADGEEVHPMIE